MRALDEDRSLLCMYLHLIDFEKQQAKQQKNDEFGANIS